MTDKYLSLATRIIEDDSLSKEEKICYLYLLEIVSKKEAKYLKQKEDKSYYYNGKSLSDKERIFYEINRLYQTDDEELQRKLRKILYQMKKNKTQSSIQKAKKDITKIQIKRGITPTFYTSFEEVLSSLSKEEKAQFKK